MNKKNLSLKYPCAQGVNLDDVVERKCSNCRYYDDVFCRHRPPAINRVTGLGIWPQVDSEQWCGQFKRRSLDK